MDDLAKAHSSVFIDPARLRLIIRQLSRKTQLEFIRSFALYIIVFVRTFHSRTETTTIHRFKTHGHYLSQQFGLSDHLVLYQYPASRHLGFSQFHQPTIFGQYQILTLWLISLPLLLTRSHRSIKYMGYLISALWWSLAYVEAAKGVFIALAITIFILFILYKRNMLNWLIPHLFVAIGGFVIYVLLQHLSPLVKHDTSLAMYQIQPTAGSISFRLELWHTALKMIRQHPWLGVGPMHFHTLCRTPMRLIHITASYCLHRNGDCPHWVSCYGSHIMASTSGFNIHGNN